VATTREADPRLERMRQGLAQKAAPEPEPEVVERRTRGRPPQEETIGMNLRLPKSLMRELLAHAAKVAEREQRNVTAQTIIRRLVTEAVKGG
jgi:hypothetical protein